MYIIVNLLYTYIVSVHILHTYIIFINILHVYICIKEDENYKKVIGFGI